MIESNHNVGLPLLYLQLQLKIVLVCVVNTNRLADVHQSWCVLLLHELSHRQVVVCLVVLWIQLHRLLVVHQRLLRNPQTEICVCQVFVEIVLSSRSQTLLQHHNALRISSQHVQSCSSVIVQMQSHLKLLRSVLDLEKNRLAYLQTFFGSSSFKI